MEDFSKYDTPEQKQIVRVLKQRGYPMVRKSRYHLKYREVNFFFTTGKITIDPDVKYKGKGLDAVVALLKERYPKPEKPAASFQMIVK